MRLIKKCVEIFSENKITQASAALSYYLTMTFFPMLIITYSFLGESYEKAGQLMALGERLLSSELLGLVSDFLFYVHSGERELMLPLGLSVLVVYASAGLRCIQNTIGNIQGGVEYSGLRSFLLSLVYSFVLLALSYFAIIVMLSGPEVMEKLAAISPGINRILALLPMRHLLLAALLFLFLLGLYHVPKREQDKYRVLPGAAAASLAVLILSPMFSFVMDRSIKYSLVYGTLASLVLLMLWLYMCCVLVYSGAILNVALYEVKKF